MSVFATEEFLERIKKTRNRMSEAGIEVLLVSWVLILEGLGR